jgi:hypothetical protein
VSISKPWRIGKILRLLINIPPRHSKSLGLNVFFPAWVWAQHPDPDGLDPDRALSGLGVGAKSRSGRPASRALDPARLLDGIGRALPI